MDPPLQGSPNDFDTVPHKDLSVLQLSFTSVLKIGFIKLVNLNYTSTCTICFQLMHCVKTLDNLRLFIYGDQACYGWWQYLHGSLVIPTLMMFPLSSGISLDLLKEGYISTTSFVSASVIPFYSISLLLKKVFGGLDKRVYTKDDELYVQHVLVNEETLFNFDRRYLLRWPLIQLYRNLAIVFINIFVLNPFYRCLLYVVVMFLFFTHDVHRMPYKHPSLNILQMISSSLLIIVATCNIPAPISMMGDVSAVPDMVKFLHGFKLVEMSSLMAMPSSVLGIIVWDKFR